MSIIARKPVKYLTNKELLGEINQCKKSFCSFIDDEYSVFDGIVNDLADVNKEFLDTVCARKSRELTPKGGPQVVVNPHGLIIRLMTYDHIPLDPDRKRKSRATNQTHAATTFPPFKHYLLLIEDGEMIFKEVGRSHWEGGMENGHFNPDKGRVTNRMGKMYMMLVDRYAKRGNWRGYCERDDAEALTQRGWLNGNEINETDKVLSYHDGAMKWSKIKSIYRGGYEGKMFHLKGDGIDAVVTPHHKFVTTNGLKEVDFLNDEDSIILIKNHIACPDLRSDTIHLSVKSIDFHGGKGNGALYPNEPTMDYVGNVWCPETEYGSFVVRRNGTTYITGNSYVSEMKSLALLQLSQVGLQFDESKSSNPFAFYTTTVANCLSGETEILTKEYGSVAIEKISGETVTLLDGNGDWIKCPIIDHGIRETHLNYFQDGHGQKAGIWSTANHGWVSNGKRVETSELLTRRTTEIDDLRPSKEIKNEDSYRKGVVHGFVYGDGSELGNGFRVRLCGEKHEMAPWFSGFKYTTPPSSNGELNFYINDPWTNLKMFPDNPGEDLDYLLGFLRGWLAADGCVSTLAMATICGDEEEYNWIKTWAPLVGWHGMNFVKLNSVTNYGVRNKVSLNIHLRSSSLETSDFLRTKHSDRWKDRPTSYSGKNMGKKHNWQLIEQLKADGKDWTTIAEIVGSNKSTLAALYCVRKQIAKRKAGPRKWLVYGHRQPDETRMERVYCPVVSTTANFAISNGIHSQNCFIRVTNLEKKNQNIRDDLLIAMGAEPSYTRQVDNELSQNGSIEPKAIPTRRGRKTAAQVGAEQEAAKPIQE